jgi:hypothetical protein
MEAHNMVYFGSVITDDMLLAALKREGMTPQRVVRFGLVWRAYFTVEEDNAVRLFHNRLYRKGSDELLVGGHGLEKCDMNNTYEPYVVVALKGSR